MAIEIVSFPMNSMVDLSIVFCKRLWEGKSLGDFFRVQLTLPVELSLHLHISVAGIRSISRRFMIPLRLTFGHGGFQPIWMRRSWHGEIMGRSQVKMAPRIWPLQPSNRTWIKTWFENQWPLESMCVFTTLSHTQIEKFLKRDCRDFSNHLNPPIVRVASVSMDISF